MPADVLHDLVGNSRKTKSALSDGTTNVLQIANGVCKVHWKHLTIQCV